MANIEKNLVCLCLSFCDMELFTIHFHLCIFSFKFKFPSSEQIPICLNKIKIFIFKNDQSRPKFSKLIRIHWVVS